MPGHPILWAPSEDRSSVPTGAAEAVMVHAMGMPKRTAGNYIKVPPMYQTTGGGTLVMGKVNGKGNISREQLGGIRGGRRWIQWQLCILDPIPDFLA